MNGSTPSLHREAGRRLLGSLFFRLLIVLLILYTVYHCAVAAAPRMTTAIVVQGEEQVMTTGQATLFRDEHVLTADGQGLLLSYPLESAAKVSADSALATLYTTARDAQELAALHTYPQHFQRTQRLCKRSGYDAPKRDDLRYFACGDCRWLCAVSCSGIEGRDSKAEIDFNAHR